MKILKCVGLFALAVLVSVGSFFVPKTNKSASADVNIPSIGAAFESSNLIVSCFPYVSSPLPFNQLVSQSNSNTRFLNTSFYLSFEDGNYGPNIMFASWAHYGYFSTYNDAGIGDEDLGYSFIGRLSLASIFTNSTNFIERDNVLFNTYNEGTRYTSFVCGSYNPSPVSYSEYSLDDFDFTIVSVEIGNNYSPEFVSLGIGGQSNYSNSTIVCYTTKSNIKLFFFVPNWQDVTSSSGDDITYSYRKYLFDSYFDLSDNSVYQEGINYGRSEGYDDGYNLGYRAGSSVGYENGFENGKIEGALTANNYSFFGLISAVIDAPVKILTSLFNFNFLGVNLWAFFTSILTISLIIFVIRKFMAKG